MAKTGPLNFCSRFARSDEGHLPSRRETLVTTVLVVLMAVTASIFFLLADQVISRAMGLILGLGH